MRGIAPLPRLGPFQFLETTFLDVVRRNFPALASEKTDVEILALRTDFQVSRDVALIYTRENAAALAAKGKETTAATSGLPFSPGPTARSGSWKQSRTRWCLPC